MPTYFPQVLASKAAVQIPYTTKPMYETVEMDLDAGSRLSYARRGAGLTNFPTGPLWSFETDLELNDTQLATLNTFYETQAGSLFPFIYLDPGGNLVPNSENFGDASWQNTGVTVGGAVADPFGGTLARTLTSSVSNALLAAIVVPDGSAAGTTINASAWMKAAGAGQTISVGFVDSGFTVLDSQTFTLPQGVWKRVSFKYTIVGSSYIRVLFGGFNTWGTSQAIIFFSPQVSAGPGPGGRVASPFNYGYHPNCRFGMDAIRSKRITVNRSLVSGLKVQEFFA